MLPPLAPHPWFVTERCAHESFQAAAVYLERKGSQSRIATDGVFSCVLDGEFYNSRELRNACQLGSATNPSDAEVLLKGWQLQGENFVRQINGSFSAVIWNSQAQVATLLTDRWGNRPLYYSDSSQQLAFASSVQSLVCGMDCELDVSPRGVAQFFTFGHYLDCDTSLENVKVLPASACWKWSARTGFAKDIYYSLDEVGAEAARSDALWIGDIGDAFQAAVISQTHDTANLGLSLSGGLDARTILAAVDQTQSPLKTVCLGIPGSLDHRCAQQLAEMVGCENHAHILDTHFLAGFRSHLESMVRLTDGQYLSQCIEVPTLPLYRKLGIEVLLRGHAGELMHMYKAYNYSLDEEALQISNGDQLNTWLFKRLSAYMMEGVSKPVLRSHLQRDFDSLARESLASDIASTAHVELPAQRIWQLFVVQRLRRETVLSLNEFRSVVETRLPFLDNRLISLLLAAPPQLKLGETIQAALLKRFRPEFLKVVNANTGTKVGAGALRRKFSSLKLRALAKLGVAGYQPYERLGLWLKRDLRDLVEQMLLSSETLDRGIYDPDGVRTVISNHQSGRGNHTYLIMALMIFELGMRHLSSGAFDARASARDLRPAT